MVRKRILQIATILLDVLALSALFLPAFENYGATDSLWTQITENFLTGSPSGILTDAIYYLPIIVSGILVALLESKIRYAVTLFAASGGLTLLLSQYLFPAVEQAEGMLAGVVNFAISTIVFLLATFYMMTDYPGLHRIYARIVPQTVQKKLSIMRGAARKAFYGYFRAEFILSAGVGVIAGVSLAFYGQPFAILIAAVVCIVDFIPILGAGTVLIPWGCIVLLAGDFQKAALLFVITFVVFLGRKLLEPKIVGGQTGLPTVLSLLCIYVGMVWGGILGMVFVPALFLMVVEMKRGGFFDGMIADLQMLFEEIGELLQND